MTDEPRCPLCHRARRGGRPLCNTHLRRTGPTILEKYFVQAKAAERSQLATAPVHRTLAATIDTMTANARRHDEIKAEGQRPIWDGSQWVNPRDRALGYLYNRLNQYGLTHDTVAAMVDDLYPPERKRI